MELYNGRIYGSTLDNDVYASAPRAYSWFNYTDDCIPFSLQGIKVRGLCAVNTGIYVLSDRGIIYLHGGDIDEFSISQLSSSPVMEDCCVKTTGNNVLDGKLQQYGTVGLVMTEEGLCLLGNDGLYKVLTDGILDLPSCSGITMALHNNRIYTLLQR